MIITKFTLLFLTILLIINCSSDIKNVNYSEHVKPILDDRCVGCHASDGAEGNVNLETYDAIQTSRYKNHSTAMIVPGNLQASRLYIVVNTRNESMRMPPQRLGEDRLPDSEIETIRVWIQEGAAEN